MYIGATDPEIRMAIFENVAAGIVNAKNPAVEGAQIGDLEIGVALLEAGATSHFALRGDAALAIGNSIPEDATTAPRFEFRVQVAGGYAIQYYVTLLITNSTSFTENYYLNLAENVLA